MQKVLLLDTNVSSLPILEFLERSNYDVYLVGSNPADSLAKSAKGYIDIDYSNVAEIRDLIASLGIDFIVPGCNDLSYLVCTEINTDKKFYGLETTETTAIINSKEQFRQFAEINKLPVPRVFPEDQGISAWPVIVKPVDAYSGRGVTIVTREERDSLSQAVRQAKEFSRSGKCIIEEYVDGQLYSHTAFIADGNVLIDFIVEEHGTANPFVVDTSRVIYNFPMEILQRVREAIIHMVRHLNLTDGLIHTQFIKRNEQFWIIEVTKRCPGDLYSRLIELSTGFPYAEFYTRPFLNQKNFISDGKMEQRLIMRHTVSLTAERVFTSLKFKLPVRLESFIPLSSAGDKIKASPYGRIALLFIECDSDEELSEIFDITLKRELYLI